MGVTNGSTSGGPERALGPEGARGPHEQDAAGGAGASERPFRKGFSLAMGSWEEAGRCLELIAAAGFEGVEPTINPGAVPSPEHYEDDARELKRRADDLGLRIPGMRAGRTPWTTIPSPDPARRREALEHTERACECLAEMGGRVLLVVPGRIDPAVTYFEHWQRVVEYARRAGEIAEQFETVIGLENVEARFPLSVREWMQLLDEIDHPRVRMYLDVGNVVWLGLGFPEQWITSLGGRIGQVHFKDADFGGGLRSLLEGEVNWPAVIGALHGIGYRGWILVEPSWYAVAPHRLSERLSRDLDAIFDLNPT